MNAIMDKLECFHANSTLHNIINTWDITVDQL
jgi:hypothetical protein